MGSQHNKHSFLSKFSEAVAHLCYRHFFTQSVSSVKGFGELPSLVISRSCIWQRDDMVLIAGQSDPCHRAELGLTASVLRAHISILPASRYRSEQCQFYVLGRSGSLFRQRRAVLRKVPGIWVQINFKWVTFGLSKGEEPEGPGCKRS